MLLLLFLDACQQESSTPSPSGVSPTTTSPPVVATTLDAPNTPDASAARADGATPRESDRGDDPPVEPTDRDASFHDDVIDHVEALRQRIKDELPDGEFHIVVQQPFVVIGDSSLATVERWARGTVKWATDRLKESYFDNDPKEILDVWLFRNKQSYEANTLALFGSEPTTPFGYYSPSDRALVMNIATGGGTLVHEIVHPFVEANFPMCPAWFNEGLGSLYEQSQDHHGKIRGLTNWRLAGLQSAIREQKLPSFKALTGMNDYVFYREDRGDNYAQSRYLLYYLQEKKLLRRYYKAFLAARDEDPRGYETLKSILGVDDMQKFQEAWESYVLELRYP